MSETQHIIDVAGRLPHNMAGASGGGACLNRHLGDKPCEGVNKSCSHRWHSYLQMKGDSGLYNWPKYKTLSERKNRIKTAAEKKDGTIFPDWYKYTLAVPEKGDWDVTGDNFFRECYTPYWHEAHHIVPNSTLREAIATVGSKLVVRVRRGLLEEKYNLNHKDNMVMLPLDKEVADAIGLPRHRQTASHFHHSAYSDHVKTQLNGYMKKVKEKLKDHKDPDYTALANDIIALSKNLYNQITINTSSNALDDMPDTEFVFS